MLSMGENPKFIQRQLGHADISTTLNQYGHLLPEVSAKFGERLDTFLFSTNVTPIQFKKEGELGRGEGMLTANPCQASDRVERPPECSLQRRRKTGSVSR